MKYIIALPLIAGLAVYSWLVNVYVISTLWAWFIVPVFHLPAVSGISAYGLGLTVSFMTRGAGAPSTNPRNENSDAAHFVLILLRPWLFLLMGHVGRWAVSP